MWTSYVWAERTACAKALEPDEEHQGRHEGYLWDSREDISRDKTYNTNHRIHLCTRAMGSHSRC